jgi:hypothetical protein
LDRLFVAIGFTEIEGKCFQVISVHITVGVEIAQAITSFKAICPVEVANKNRKIETIDIPVGFEIAVAGTTGGPGAAAIGTHVDAPAIGSGF